MSSISEQSIIEERQKKLLALKKAGIDPYPAKAIRTHKSMDFHKDFKKLCRSSVEVKLVGRIRALRRIGKVAFMMIEDDTGTTQAFFEKKQLPKDYDLIKNLDVGDFISVSGLAFSTKTKEDTIRVIKFQILSKTLRQLPEKFHGLKNQELRLRKRELDLIMNKKSKDLFLKRALMLRYLRDFLDLNKFLEVETPVLQNLPGGAEANPFVTHHDAMDLDLNLRIAPEIYLKRLIVGGFERVYELGKVFRNEGLSTQHLQEFTTLEFYMAYANYETLIDLSQRMIVDVLKKTFGTLKFKYQNNAIDFTPPWPKIDYISEIKKHTGIDLIKILDEKSLKKAIQDKKLKVHLEPKMGYGRMIDNLFKATVRPKIKQPVFLIGHPLAISPLAKRNPKTSLQAERFQILVAGFEIANAYSELNDPAEQAKRFDEQVALRKAGDNEAHVKDREFIEALEYGLPPTAGFGLGVDRLLALAMDADNVREVVFFPTLKPDNKKK